MSLENSKQSLYQRQRNILHLIAQYLDDFGLKQSKNALLTEARLSNEFKVCDNIDLDTIYLDYCSYYNLKFGKHPKIVKRVENDLTTPQPKQMKTTKSKCIEATSKRIDEGRKVTEANKAENAAELSLSETIDVVPCFRGLESERHPVYDLHHKRSTALEQFSGELLELAHTIEASIVKRSYGLTWDDIQGNEMVKQTLHKGVLLPIKHPNLFTALTKPWNGILLHGASGVGKTHLAKALCSETFGIVTFFNISASTLISKWRGESEKFLKVLFTMAKLCAPSIIFIDEFESLASHRDTSGDHEATKRFKNELLIQIDDLETADGHVLLLANSNLPWEIDAAFLRRFERKILIDLPTNEIRLCILKKLIPAAMRWTESDYDEFVQISDGFTGADLKIASKEASLKKIHESLKTARDSIECKVEVSFRDLMDAIEHIKPTMNELAAKHRQWNAKCGNQL